ncbi:glycoside hydrolase family 43 protein [Luoshenia tenuis]|jgi:xylan 1,4-beta-xylosidase|uniref:glycoside hydrolase family 43 protein n=2 Tax=Clostridia TaxID=186801 RepID=UPI003D8BBB6A
MGFRNPIIPGYNPDPSVCRVGEDYYLVTSSFEDFPGVPVYHSRDMVNWEQIGYCLTRRSQLELKNCPPSRGIFAPVIRYHQGRFYMITTNVSHGGNFYVWTEDPAGEWSEPIFLAQGGIDPSLFFDDDGKVYLTSNQPTGGDWTIAQSEIDIATGQLLTKPRTVWTGTGGRHPEGPHLYKINGKYYLMIAEGGTELGHMETIARSDSPYGPFESCPHNPILTHRGNPLNLIQGTGHADLIQAHDGSWWLVFLAFRMTRNAFHHLGRESFMAPVTWDEDGWPHVYNDGQIRIDMECETLPLKPLPKAPKRDDFDGEHLALPWNYLRNPNFADYDLNTGRKSAIGLRCGAYNLFDWASPSFIGRRQEQWDCEAYTLLDFEPRAEGEEAGFTTYFQPLHHYEIALTRKEGKRVLIVRRNAVDMCYIAFEREVEPGPIVLGVKADKMDYTFMYGRPGEQMQVACTASTLPVSIEASTTHATGMFLGLYATANGAQSQNWAYFDWFDYSVGDE